MQYPQQSRSKTSPGKNHATHLLTKNSQRDNLLRSALLINPGYASQVERAASITLPSNPNVQQTRQRPHNCSRSSLICRSLISTVHVHGRMGRRGAVGMLITRSERRTCVKCIASFYRLRTASPRFCQAEGQPTSDGDSASPASIRRVAPSHCSPLVGPVISQGIGRDAVFSRPREAVTQVGRVRAG